MANVEIIGLRVKESQSDRFTESQIPKGTQYTGGQIFFVPDFNKLPHSLRSQGDKKLLLLKMKKRLNLETEVLLRLKWFFAEIAMYFYVQLVLCLALRVFNLIEIQTS